MDIMAGGSQAAGATVGGPVVLQSDPGGLLLLLAFFALVYLVAQSDDGSEATTIECRNKDCSHTWTVEDDDGFEAECPLCGMHNER